MLKNKKVILGVTGSIAAYKAAFLVRLLVKAGAEVRVLMTPAATQFISPLTLSTLSKHPVHTAVSAEDSWNNHVEMGLWADAMVIAPVTATTLSKMAHGICDNIIVATYLSARCPVFFAPAMDLDMWQHPATRENVTRLREFGNHLIPVAHGELASGLVGEGRMAEPEEIVAFLDTFFKQSSTLSGKKVLITAGPTYEPIDPVRFIGNRSSGKMGIALADEAANRGAEVTLVLGPTHLKPSQPTVHTISVETAAEMFEATKDHFSKTDVAILAAAVADYRPEEVATQKIKKKSDTFTVALTQNPDIAATLGKQKQKGQLLIGFALETQEEEDNAKGKLEKKNFDFIVLNSLRDAGAGFNTPTNKISIIHRDNKINKYELKSKEAVARDILSEVEQLLMNTNKIQHNMQLRKLFALAIGIGMAALLNGQELNATVKINTQKLQVTDPKVFETLEQTLVEFLNNQKWTNDVFENEERINCNFLLTIQEEYPPNGFKAHLAVQSSRPVYDSDYETPMLNYIDKDVTFAYEQYQPVVYSRNNYNDNLSSVLAFYVQIMLGMDYDSFAPLGGEEYYQRAQEIVNNVPPAAASNNPGWTSTGNNRNRFWLIENILSPRTKSLRRAMYDYHRLGLDLMANDVDAGRTNMAQALDVLPIVNQSYPNTMILALFSSTKSQEIVEIFKRGTLPEQNQVMRAMVKIDPANASRYREIKQ